MKLLILLLSLSFVLASCSGSKSSEDVSEEEQGIQLSDAEEFTEEEIVEEEIVDGDEEGQTEEVVADNSASNVQIDSDGEMQMYTVQKNETLMLISFKLYGDYGKWKQLADWNDGELNGSTALSSGMSLKYYPASEDFVWNPEGSPYLIKRGDTLGTISEDTYETNKYWKEIWYNNKPLIKDPNVIFAGFTIYTPEIDGRGVANDDE